MNRTIYIIGVGGVGSWLARSMSLLIGPKQLCLIDGDTLEKKNLDRQLFTAREIGQFKAEALALKYEITDYLNEWYSAGKIDHGTEDILMVCVDNDAARMSALMECDRCRCSAIICANETFSSEAYYYRSEWKDSPLDPRVFYPEMRSERGPDPARRAAGCTGEVQQENPQLVSANFSAAALAQNLFVFWGMEFPKTQWTEKDMQLLPYHYRSSLTRLETILIKDKLPTPMTVGV